jgi:hypothetical protein
MSLVITVVSTKAVVQVSDTRLSSLADRTPRPEKQRKSIIVIGKQACFVLGWVGLALVNDGFKTGDWLFQELNGMNAVELPLADIAGNLTGLATEQFKKLQVPPKDKCCHFVLGGWHRVSGVPELFTCVIYNDLIFNAEAHHGQPIWTEAFIAASQFMYSIGSFRPVKTPFNVHAIGSGNPEKLKPHFKVLKSLMERRAGTAAITATCLKIAREAARHTPTVGKDLIAVDMDKNGHTHCSYYSGDGAEEILVPDIISLRGSSTHATLRAMLSGNQVTLRVQAKVVRRTKK